MDLEKLENHVDEVSANLSCSSREAFVGLVHLIGQEKGYTNKQLAESIDLAPSTYSEHLSNFTDSIEPHSAADNYWRFSSESDINVKYTVLFDINDIYNHLRIYESKFKDTSQEAKYIAVHEQSVISPIKNKQLKRNRRITDWYEFYTVEELAQGICENIDFAQGQISGEIGFHRFKSAFEDKFGFDPTEVENAFEFSDNMSNKIPDSHRKIFCPTDSKRDIFEKLCNEYQKINTFVEDRKIDNLQLRNPIISDNATIVITSLNEPDTNAVLTIEDEVFVTVGAECECGNHDKYEPSMSESAHQSYDMRRNAACKHNTAVLNSVIVSSQNNIPLDSPLCPVCGYTALNEKKSYNRGQWIMSSYSCAVCNEKLESN